MTTVPDSLAIVVNTGNGDTGPTWAVALFAVAWVLLASFIVHMKVRKWKKQRDANRGPEDSR